MEKELTEQEKIVFALGKLSESSDNPERKEELNTIRQKILVNMANEENKEENQG